MAKTITLKFTMSDGSVQEASFTVPSDSGISSVAVSNGLTGDGSSDNPIALSLKSSDGTVKITQIENNGGVDLSATPASSGGITRSTIGGNFSFGYPDQPTKDEACGMLNWGCYFKTTVTLYKAAKGDVTPIVHIDLNEIPCDADGTPLPYNIELEPVAAATSSTQPTVVVWLIFPNPPSHKQDRKTRARTKLVRSSSASSGMPDIPTASVASELTYLCTYYHA